MAEGAPLLREYTVMSCIKGSNPFVSAKKQNAPYETCAPRGFFFVRWILKVRLSTRRDERMLGGSLL